MGARITPNGLVGNDCPIPSTGPACRQRGVAPGIPCPYRPQLPRLRRRLVSLPVL